MAKTRKPFGNRRSDEGILANAKAEEAKANPTMNKPVTSLSSGKPAVVPAPVTADTVVKDADVAGEVFPDSDANVSTYMSIIAGMPPETKNRYLSAFTDFLALDPAKQKTYLDALSKQAGDIVAPMIAQERTRLNEDTEYSANMLKQQKKSLQETFDRVISDMDFSRNRDIAKENKSAGEVMRRISDTSFVTGVAGAGVNRRRGALAREGLQENVDDININYNQNKNTLALKKAQGERTLDAEIDRLFQLNGRGLTDLDQKEKTDALSMFLELTGNKFGKVGDQNAQLLEAGIGGEADAAAGGTDAERKARFQEFDRYLPMKPEEILADKFDANTLQRIQKYDSFGDVIGSSDGRVQFKNQPSDWQSDVDPNDYAENWAPKVQMYRDILNGKFKSDIRGKLRMAPSPQV